MDRTAATYKMREGLLYYNHKEVVNKMIEYPFSITWANVPLIIINVYFRFW